MNVKTPSFSDAHTRAFCEKLVAGGVPISIVPNPPPDAALNDCVNLVDAAVQRIGGERLDGWAIWERPGIFIEAEYHCIWRMPEGEVQDLAPLLAGVTSRLFLHDPHLVYEGCQINNVRHALDPHPSIRRLIRAYDAHFEVLNKGERAYQHGEVRVPREELAPVLEEIVAAELAVVRRAHSDVPSHHKVGRNERCPCGSGLKYKRCHGK